MSYSTDLKTWTEPEVVIRPEFKWEDNRIGGATPPVRTDRGWLVLYHGVENTNPVRFPGVETSGSITPLLRSEKRSLMSMGLTRSSGVGSSSLL